MHRFYDAAMDLGLLFLVAQWCVGWWIGLGLRSLPRRIEAAPTGPEVAVIVPARNEAHQISALLNSLHAQTLQPAEIVVVDDGSDDATAAIAHDHGARVVVGQELPADWNGKAWACEQGVGATRAPLMVLLDADTTLAPDALERIAAVTRPGVVISVQPWHATRTVREGLSAANNLFAIQGAGLTGLWRKPPVALAFGPCLAMTRETYGAIGGFAAVRNRVPEDLALARAARAAGVVVAPYAGRSAVTFRMYPEGVRTMVRGFARNLAAGMRAIRIARLIAVIWWIVGLVTALGLGVRAMTPDASLSGRVIGAVALIAFTVQWSVLVRSAGTFGWLGTWVFPLPLAVFAVSLVRSLWWRVSGRSIRWRGRPVQARSTARA